MRKLKGLLMSVLFLAGVLTLAFNIPLVKASGTVYIRPDGSVDPPSAPISTADNITYTLTDNINGSIVVERDNIVLDGAGYTVQGIGAYIGIGNVLSGRSNVTVKNTTVTGFQYGIYLFSSSNTTVSGNNVNNNNVGIRLEHSSNNTIWGNNASDNIYGISLEHSENNTISANTVTNNNVGISLVYSGGNTAWGNTVSDNIYGISLWGSSNNYIDHNNFNNTNQVYNSESNNTWDDGYPSGGNYWSDYNGNDSYRGPYQNVTGSDGIGDTPYEIDANNQDNYPLMNPWSPHDIAILNVTSFLPYNATAVYPGWTVNVNVTVRNEGEFNETFTVTAYYGGTHNSSGVTPIKSFTIDGEDTQLYVNPPSIINLYTVGQTFTVRVYVENVTDLYTWVAGLKWDPTVLDCLSVQYMYDWFPGADALLYGKDKGYVETPGAIDNVGGYATPYTMGRRGYTFPNGTTVPSTFKGINGSGPLFNATFQVKNYGETWINITGPYAGPPQLINSSVQAIPADIQSGWFELSPPPPPTIHPIGTQTVINLAPGAEQTLTFTWNTADVAPCGYNYTIGQYIPYPISAYADPVPGETNITDNTFINGNVTVRRFGDANGDGHCDGYDYTMLNAHWLMVYPQVMYDPNADFNGDGSIDGFDYTYINVNWLTY